MADLVALAVPPGPGFVAALERIWDAGDAVLPLDPATPAPFRADLLLRLGAGALVDEVGGSRRPLRDGRPVEPGDALVLATSGTTGAPKGVVLTHDAVEYAAYATCTALGVGVDTRWLACLPLSHAGGLSVVTRARTTGAGLDLLARPEPAAIDAAAAAGATHVSLVPTLLGRIDATRWRAILLGGSAAPSPRPANVVATYGMTETYGGVVYDGLALNGVEVRIAGAERRAAGAPGPIELRSPTLLRCYRDGTDPRTPDGWFPTADLGSLDQATGRLSVHGRSDDLIISGGEKVWPHPVEALIAEDPRVAEVAVVGVPDDEWGQRVVAVVVPTDPSDPPTLASLRERVRDRLPAPAAPKELRLADSLPRTTLGKIARHRLDPRTAS